MTITCVYIMLPKEIAVVSEVNRILTFLHQLLLSQQVLTEFLRWGVAYIIYIWTKNIRFKAPGPKTGQAEKQTLVCGCGGIVFVKFNPWVGKYRFRLSGNRTNNNWSVLKKWTRQNNSRHWNRNSLYS